MTLKTYYHLPVRRPELKTSVQPDDVIRGHRAGDNSPQSQCDPSPRRTAVDTGSEEPKTPPRWPAIGTGPGPGVSRADTQKGGEITFPLETSMNGFLRSNCTITKQEYVLLHQPDVGVDDEKEITATFTTSRCSGGFHESYGEATAARDDSLGYRAEQPV